MGNAWLESWKTVLAANNSRLQVIESGQIFRPLASATGPGWLIFHSNVPQGDAVGVPEPASLVLLGFGGLAPEFKKIIQRALSQVRTPFLFKPACGVGARNCARESSCTTYRALLFDEIIRERPRRVIRSQQPRPRFRCNRSEVGMLALCSIGGMC